MWLRTQVLKPSIPEEPTGPLNVHPIVEPSPYDSYGYGG